MKFASLSYIASNSTEAFKRFPFTILSSIIAMSIGLFLIEEKRHIDNIFPYVNALLTFALGIPLFFCAKIFLETKDS